MGAIVVRSYSTMDQMIGMPVWGIPTTLSIISVYPAVPGALTNRGWFVQWGQSSAIGRIRQMCKINTFILLSDFFWTIRKTYS